MSAGVGADDDREPGLARDPWSCEAREACEQAREKRHEHAQGEAGRESEV